MLLFCSTTLFAQQKPVTSYVGEGWAGNSVNVVVFRKNALATAHQTQFIAYYDKDAHVVLGKRTLPAGKWELKTTPLKGNAADAHNTICLEIDGKGYLHLAWDHHANALRYCKSKAPFSLEMTEKMSMTGTQEEKVTYPEFYRTPDGNLLFLYRDGRSGQGNLVMNRYDVQTARWQRVHNNLVDGENMRNAYWQACMDSKGVFHLSWVWRESGDASTNHDLCYARSRDGGLTWEKSTGEKYQLPINTSNAEYICRIPQKSELINQTSMCTDENGRPFVATYWREQGDSIPQYHVAFLQSGRWMVQSLKFRRTPFSLSGGGTKRIPVSRPQIIAWGKSNVALVFRDEERSNRVSIAVSRDVQRGKWTVTDLTDTSVGSWEPSYDTELWRTAKKLHLFVQMADQRDGEGRSDLPPQPVTVLEWDPTAGR